jgi:hypothetical protein
LVSLTHSIVSFGTLLGSSILHYSFGTALLISLFLIFGVVLTIAGLLWLNYRKSGKKLPLQRYFHPLLGFGWCFVDIIVGILFALISSLILGSIQPYFWYSTTALATLFYVPSALIGILLGRWILSNLQDRFHIEVLDVYLGVVFFYLSVLLIACIGSVGGGYLIFWYGLFAALGALVMYAGPVLMERAKLSLSFEVPWKDIFQWAGMLVGLVLPSTLSVDLFNLFLSLETRSVETLGYESQNVRFLSQL